MNVYPQLLIFAIFEREGRKTRNWKNKSVPIARGFNPGNMMKRVYKHKLLYFFAFINTNYLVFSGE